MHFSHKVKISIEQNIKKIMERTFEEAEVKSLILDLRESAKFHLKKLTDTQHIDATKQFIEIADFIAHTNRDRGLMEENIRCFAEACLQALLTAKGEDVIDDVIPPVPKYLTGDMIALGLTINAQFYLQHFDECSVDIQQIFTEAFKVKEEIALCVISILQGAFIQLKNGHGCVVLNIVVHEGKYRLYCAHQNSKIESTVFQTNGTLLLNFPVIVTNTQDIDGILSRNTSSDYFGDIEVYRDQDKLLHVRALGNSYGPIRRNEQINNLYNKIQSLVDKKLFDEAIEACMSLLQIAPNAVQALTISARLFYKYRNEVTLAERTYTKILEIWPDYLPALSDLAQLYTETGDLYSAEKTYLKTIQMFPNNADVLGDYAVFLEFKQNNIQKAEVFYKRAISEDSMHYTHLGNYALFLAMKRIDIVAANEMFKRAILANPVDKHNLHNYEIFKAVTGLS